MLAAGEPRGSTISNVRVALGRWARWVTSTCRHSPRPKTVPTESVASYSFWKVGQYTRFAGVEREPEGNVHFAGEHTSVNSQGYRNGAVETGQRAAQELLSA